jgi:NAD(P)-dependent dehydrogenase (short-subunit alcohol dehydrogenase family)
MLRPLDDAGGGAVLLEGRNAVVYGGGGVIGGAVARAFAREGARVFLAGRSLATLEVVASEVSAAGGRANVAVVDTLDAEAVDRHADAVAAEAGGIDVSFLAISHGDVHGMPLLDMPYEDFARPVEVSMRSLFLTTRAVARHMVDRGSGVIMTITATTAQMAIPNVGGTGVSFDSIESQCRQWASELGRRGVRVVWLQTTGIPEAMHGLDELFPDYGTPSRMTGREIIAWLTSRTMLGRMATLEDVGNAAAFLASDRAAGMTAIGANLSGGTVPAR